ncbi:AraC family transcriptional regulator [Sphingobacterium sp. 1.A.5]|jgi:AraC-like DNA-binding protein|uniref:helix-turn-helix domain-containing protein n=1 Tax=Sphingobacterium sp. 1.A.5 TaxID=2044604 RepID=UPI000C0BCB78|nr:helix-turn-helix domain-containing protein [Sphingobacterium sp. 1.A.5]
MSQNAGGTEKKRYSLKPEREEIIIRRIKEWEIGRRYRDPRYNFDRFTEDVGVNKKYLSRVINRNFGTNFSAYINSLRLGDVREMIGDLGPGAIYNLTAIALLAGFSSYFKFSHYIKTAHGVNPTDYFRQNRPL